MNARTWSGLGALALVGTLALGARWSAPAEPSAEPVENAARSAQAKPDAREELPRTTFGLTQVTQVPQVVAPLPPSLQDTEVDGEWPLTASGHLRVNVEVRRRLEYFFSATGEESEAQMAARIVADLARLPEPAQSEARALLAEFLEYRRRGRSLSGATPAERFDAVHALRQDIFGSAHADALFGDDEARDRKAIAQLGAATPPQPVLDEIQQRVSEEQELRAQGATAEDLHQLRLQAVGAEAAARLDALDASRAEWKARVEAFEHDRAQLAADAQAEQRLLEQRFSEPERVRVRALERISAR